MFFTLVVKCLSFVAYHKTKHADRIRKKAGQSVL